MSVHQTIRPNWGVHGCFEVKIENPNQQVEKLLKFLWNAGIKSRSSSQLDFAYFNDFITSVVYWSTMLSVEALSRPEKTLTFKNIVCPLDKYSFIAKAMSLRITRTASEISPRSVFFSRGGGAEFITVQKFHESWLLWANPMFTSKWHNIIAGSSWIFKPLFRTAGVLSVGKYFPDSSLV